MFIAVLFIIAQNLKQFKYSLMNGKRKCDLFI